MVVFKNTVGTNNPNSKLTREQVLEIRRLYKDGKPAKEIAVQFGVSKNCAYQVAKRLRYASVE